MNIGSVKVSDRTFLIIRRSDYGRVCVAGDRLFINHYFGLSIRCTLFGDTPYDIMCEEPDFPFHLADGQIAIDRRAVKLGVYALSILSVFPHYIDADSIRQITRDSIVTDEFTLTNWRFDDAALIGEVDGITRKFSRRTSVPIDQYDLKNIKHALEYPFGKVIEAINSILPQPIAEEVTWEFMP